MPLTHFVREMRILLVLTRDLVALYRFWLAFCIVGLIRWLRSYGIYMLQNLDSVCSCVRGFLVDGGGDDTIYSFEGKCYIEAVRAGVSVQFFRLLDICVVSSDGKTFV